MLHKVVDYFVFTGLFPGRRPISHCRDRRASIGGDAPGVAYTIGTTEMISPRYQQADLLSHPPYKMAEVIASVQNVSPLTILPLQRAVKCPTQTLSQV